jgi:hypothetical protein
MRKTKVFLGMTLIGLGIYGLATAESRKESQVNPSLKDGNLRVAVVGDTGIGERAFHRGFMAVQEAIRNHEPDVLLHLGDFIYQPEFKPEFCPDKYIREVEETLVNPYPYRLFVPGDNDLPPKIKKPKASGCWSRIDPLDTAFDIVADSDKDPALFEGTKIIGNSFFAILNTYPWKDPTGWLAPRIREARKKGLWIIVALHEPAITTAWYLDKRDTVLKQINALQPDLVFSGNQHSYERFHPLGLPEPGEELAVRKSESSRYQRGEGPIHIISGGGGATFKPFADQQGKKNRTAPDDVFNALAKRALMNHYILLEISTKVLRGTTYRVCPAKEGAGEPDPRWKPHKPMWENITLECSGKPEGVAQFDKFEILR